MKLSLLQLRVKLLGASSYQEKRQIVKSRTLLKEKKLTKRKQIQKRLKKHLAARHRAERRFRAYGVMALSVSFLFLAVLLISIIGKGYSAFLHSEVQLEVYFDPEVIYSDDQQGHVDLQRVNYSKLVQEAIARRFPDVQERRSKMQLYSLISKGAAYKLQKRLTENISLVGNYKSIWLPLASDADMYIKGQVQADDYGQAGRLSAQQVNWLDTLEDAEKIRSGFNGKFFTSGDSREPEMAGILGSFVGSIFVIISCMALALPLGVATGIYLEEFASKNRFTELVEVNINNLAAVPSIVFGLLGLAVYLQFIGIPRSAALAGGLTLALLILPTIVITTRTALRTVPPSIRDAAVALGASRMQMVWHHVLPLSVPGIMTGAILGMARAMGETAPLLMIGMVAFVVEVPGSFLDPATAMPVQVYLWADSPEAGFAEKTSAAILVLLVLLVLANGVAAYIRNRFERRW